MMQCLILLRLWETRILSITLFGNVESSHREEIFVGSSANSCFPGCSSVDDAFSSSMIASEEYSFRILDIYGMLALWFTERE